MGGEEEQNMQRHSMPAWHVDYFELKAIKAKQTQKKKKKKPLTSPLTT